MPAGTTIAPVGAVAGPLRSEVFPQIFAGGELGHDPFETGRVVVVVVAVVGGAVVAGGALVVVVAGFVVGAVAVVVAAMVVAGAVLVGAGSALVGGEVAVLVGETVGVDVMPLLETVKSPRRRDVVPSDQVSKTSTR